MGERPQINWAAIAAMPCEGDDIPVGPRRNPLGTTSLTPPVMDGFGQLPGTNTVAPRLPEFLNIVREFGEFHAFRRDAMTLMASALDLVSMLPDRGLYITGTGHDTFKS